ncbi:MAG: hypothetical protein HJJLKODD_01035 [Phycisphaerae bacterium]|nr:hypothetical protein [Phycisphaerae bacterium]
MDGLARWLVLLGGGVIVQWSLDYWLHLQRPMRATLLLGLVAGCIAILWRWLVRPLQQPLHLADLAEVIEARFPQLQSRLISAVQFGDPSGPAADHQSSELRSATLHQAAVALEGVPVDTLLNRTRHRRRCGIILLLAAGWAGATLLWPQTLAIAVERNLLLGRSEWPQQTRLHLLNTTEQGMIFSPRDEDLEIRYQSGGVRPRLVRLEIRRPDRTEYITMTGVGSDEFRALLPRLTENVRLRARGHDGLSDWTDVRLVDRPRIQSAIITIQPPAYTREPRYQLAAEAGQIELLTGSSVEFLFTAHQPLAACTLLLDELPVATAQPQGEQWRAQFQPQQSGIYRWTLRDTRGLENLRPQAWQIKLLADAPPVVELRIPGAGDLLTPQAILPLQLELKDRFGLAEAALAWQWGGAEGTEQQRPIGPPPRSSKQWSTSQLLHLAEWQPEIGQNLQLSALARDENDISGPGEGRSSTFRFRIATTDELLAELSRREQEYRQEFERAYSMQEQLRRNLLTWAQQLDQPAASAPLDQRTAARMQQQINRQVGLVRQQFQRLHDELRINQLDSAAVQERLGRGIIEPLGELVQNRLPALHEQLNRLADQPDASSLATIDIAQMQILRQMDAILNNMSRWEGFHETISLLQAIIQLQEELRRETDQAWQQDIDDLFDEPKNE